MHVTRFFAAVKVTSLAIISLYCRSALATEHPAPCHGATFAGAAYTICEIDLRRQSIKLFWKSPEGQPYGSLMNLPSSDRTSQSPLLFATNAGMFKPDYSPAGLYIESGRLLNSANTRSGSGNFHLKPNGVFYVAGERAGVMETGAYLRSRPRSDFATQSGPMLVIDGRLHPRFNDDSTSLKRRDGIGVRNAHTVIFAISNQEVTFSAFARLFRDRLKCPNALFLDGGSVPTLYLPATGQGSNLLPMGPMLAVFQRPVRAATQN